MHRTMLLSKLLQPFRAAAYTARRTALGGMAFVDFFKPHACAIAFIPEHGSERGPPGVEHGLGHVRSGKGGRIHVADKDGGMVVDQAPA